MVASACYESTWNTDSEICPEFKAKERLLSQLMLSHQTKRQHEFTNVCYEAHKNY